MDGCIESYYSLGEVPESSFVDISDSYKISLHGDSIFEFTSTDTDEYLSSYTKVSDEVEKRKENPTDHDGKYNFFLLLQIQMFLKIKSMNCSLN